LNNVEDYEKQDLSPYFDVAEKGINEMQFDMNRWIKVTEGLIDHTGDKQSFEAQFNESLRDESTLKGVLETCRHMKKVTPEMRKKLIEIAAANHLLDSGKKTSVFR